MTHTCHETDFVTFTPVKAPALTSRYIPALDLSLLDATSAQAVDALLAPGRRRAFFMNAHCCNTRRRNPAYARAVADADMLLPDGIGIEIAARMSGVQLAENLNGTDLVPLLLRKAAQRGQSVFLFGGKPGAACVAANTLIHRCPNLRIAGTRDGYAGAQDTDDVIAQINESGADIVLVALGVPQQELWVHKNTHRLHARLCIAVGALFDFLAGIVVRAPQPIRRARLEWAWRLAQEPRRLAKRYLAGNAAFLAHAAKAAATQAPLNDRLRRGLDLLVSSSALVVLTPVLALTAAAIKADSSGPVLFRQTRIGQDGKPFTMLKFRSMVSDAEALRAALITTSDREGVCFKSRSDPRITRVGRFIRRYSIDELPQILNVLRGDMATVGPRPALPEEVAAYPKRAMGRLAVKPGITGIWQVSGRADIGFDQMIEMDLSYAASRSVLLDVFVICKTFRAVVSSDGAY